GPGQGRRSGGEAATARPRGGCEEVRACRSDHLPRLRQKLLDAQASPDDGPQADAGRVPAAMGTAVVLPDGGPELCESPFLVGEEDRPRAQKCRSEDGTQIGALNGSAATGLFYPGLATGMAHPARSRRPKWYPRYGCGPAISEGRA